MNNMNPYIYLRMLKRVNHSVFCIAEGGQKFYSDKQFNRDLAYSSGQQVKRSIIFALASILNQKMAPITFNWEISSSGKVSQGQPLHSCNPLYVDQLVGGYMSAENNKSVIKRRSPLSISAMYPLHPLLGGIEKDMEPVNFDRREMPAEYNASKETAGTNNIRIYYKKENDKVFLTQNEILQLFEKNDRTLSAYYYNSKSPQRRASGLFVNDIAIDLRTLFCVSLNTFERELTDNRIEELKARGWIESENVFGKCLVLPREEREKVIPALANALINWRITSNQARTFSLMETLAVAISDNANTVPAAIRAKLIDNGEIQRAKPIIDETAGANVFVTLPCAGYVQTESESADALEAAEKKLIEMMLAFDYEHQV